MNIWFLAAALLALLGAIAHTWFGERGFLDPYLRSGIDPVGDPQLAAGMLRGAWHVWSLAYAASAAILGAAAFMPLDDGLRVALWSVAVMFAAAFAVVMGTTRGRLWHVSIQAAIALLTAAGLRLV